MAGVNAGKLLPVSGSPLGHLARAQYAALMRLRWRIFVNSLRTASGAFEFGARTVSYISYGIFGLLLAVGTGALAYSLVSDGRWQTLPLVFWMTLLLWQVVPVMLASFQEQFDLGILLRFPLSFSSYYLLFIVFGLSDISSMLGALCCAGIFVGVVLAYPGSWAWMLLILAAFAAFNLLLVRAIFAWIDRWLSQRKTREILAALFLVLFLGIQLANPAIWHHGRHENVAVRQMLNGPWMQTAATVQSWLPPGLAASAAHDAADGNTAPLLASFVGIGLFAIGAGWILSLRLRAEYRGENLGYAPARVKPAAEAAAARASTADRAAGFTLASLSDRSASPIPAIFAKDFRSLFRTLPLLYSIGAPLLLVLVISGSFLQGRAHPHVSAFAFPFCVFFAQMGLHQLYANSLGAEGAGVQLYFLSPTPMRTVLMAKNLFHSAVFVFVVLVAGFLAALRLGTPPALMVGITAAWLLFVLPCSLAIGNVTSLVMPYRINPGRLSRQGRSQASVFLNLFVQSLMIGVGAFVYWLGKVTGIDWLAILVFLGLALIAVVVWLQILANAGKIAANHRDQLLATLMKKA
jgi:ABC-2 type transport system permease protein